MDAGQLEEVVDHPDHPVHLGPDGTVVAGRVVGEPVLQGLGHRAQRRQRRPQVVRDPRDELAPRRLQPLLALPRLLEPTGGLGQLVGELLELRGAARPRVEAAAVTEPSRVVAHRARPAGERHAHHRRDRQGHHPGDDDHPQHHGEVVVGEEHRARRADDGGHDRQHGGERDHGDLPSERPAAHGVRKRQSAEPGRACPRGPDAEDGELVMRHCGAPIDSRRPRP